MAVEFNPMRSLIYVDCCKEEYRHKLKHWLYRYHVPDSISQFGPYVTKYAFYGALPMPKDGERFGTHRMQLTEHYWTVNPMKEAHSKALTEYFPMDVLKWQGNMPDDADACNVEGDEARCSDCGEAPPFIFAFVPVWWEEDLKGKDRTVEDGPNYRWQFVLNYPKEISAEEGDKWLYEEVLPKFKKMPEVTRILTSKIIREVSHCPYHRVVEMWFDGPTSWHKAAVEKSAEIKKPDWAESNQFPYLRPYYRFSSLFLTDTADSDNYSQYRGYITMR